MLSIYNIALIGAGNIGSRHLQALSNLNLDANLEIVDPYKQSLDVAKQRFEEVNKPKTSRIKSIHYYSELEKLSNNLDAVIIATTSDIRADLIKKLLEIKRVKNFILEKVVFQNNQEFKEIKHLLVENQIKAWINFPRRMWPFYEDLKKEVEGISPLIVQISGVNFGLGCNSIHYLDLIAYLSNSSDFKLFESLDKEIKSVRGGKFAEFTGSIFGFNQNAKFIIQSFKEGTIDQTLTISSQNTKWEINETKGTVTLYKDGAIKTTPFEIVYQSKLTNIAIEQILLKGRCDLADYDYAWKIHLPFLELILDFYNKTNSTNLERCPIT